MNIHVITTLQLLIYMKGCSLQYYPSSYPIQFQQIPEQKYYDKKNDGYEEEIQYQSRQNKNKYFKSNERYDRVDDCDSSEECKCTCNNCDDPPPRCEIECNACPQQTPTDGVATPPNVVFMPIPYIVMILPNNSTNKEVTTSIIKQTEAKNITETQTAEKIKTTKLTTIEYTTTKRTTSAGTTTERTPSRPTTAKLRRLESINDEDCSSKPMHSSVPDPQLFDNFNRRYRLQRKNDYTELIKNDNNQKLPLRDSSHGMMTLMRRTRPTWMPKYGIVPIPDRLAEKLILQLKEVQRLKEVHRMKKRW